MVLDSLPTTTDHIKFMVFNNFGQFSSIAQAEVSSRGRLGDLSSRQSSFPEVENKSSGADTAVLHWRVKDQ